MSRPSEASPRLRLAWHGKTVVGQVRANNEDNLLAATLDAAATASGDSDGEAATDGAGIVLAVADGMGGALAGEVASNLAVTTLGEEMSRGAPDGDPGPEGSRTALVDAVELANQRIRAEGESNPQQRGMGTTLTAGWVHGNSVDIAQVGDSRAYLFRDGKLAQLTKDQSLVGKLIEDGIITEEEAERIAGRNIILQALGSEEELEVAHDLVTLGPGDTLLFCTDGLSGVVNNTDIEARMQLGGTAQEVVERLILVAEERGGPDNITVLVAQLAGI